MDARKSAGSSNCAMLDYRRLGIELPREQCSNATRAMLATKLVLRFSQRWISLFNKHKLAFSEKASPRHLSTGKCPCQYIEEHFQSSAVSRQQSPIAATAARKLSYKNSSIYIPTSADAYIKTSKEQTVMQAADGVAKEPARVAVVEKQAINYRAQADKKHQIGRRKELRGKHMSSAFKSPGQRHTNRLGASGVLAFATISTRNSSACCSSSSSTVTSSSSSSSPSSSSPSPSPSVSASSVSISGDSIESSALDDNSRLPSDVRAASDVRLDVGDSIVVDSGDLIAKLRLLLASRKDQLNSPDGALFSGLLYRDKLLTTHPNGLQPLCVDITHESSGNSANANDFELDPRQNYSSQTTPTEHNTNILPPTNDTASNQKHQYHFVSYFSNVNNLKKPPSYDPSPSKKKANANHIVEIC